MQLLALDLSRNQLQRLDAYSSLPTVCPNLQILNLSDNEVCNSLFTVCNIIFIYSLITLLLFSIIGIVP